VFIRILPNLAEGERTVDLVAQVSRNNMSTTGGKKKKDKDQKEANSSVQFLPPSRILDLFRRKFNGPV